ncbi:phosphotriesterase family protein [Streptomyces griseus]|uniref:phosphotriesterase family protein n=1 Tax=Streptomyces griseus TaxID=1911 RepID=UPI0037029FE2
MSSQREDRTPHAPAVAPTNSRYAIGVNGAIPKADLGITLPHEHLLVKGPRYMPGGEDDVCEPPALTDRWRLLKDPAGYRVNLDTGDVAETVQELSFFRAAGGSTVVDLSSHGLATKPQRLPEVAERSGLNIITATGLYISDSHPEWAATASVEELTERFVTDLTNPIDDEPRCGAIGEIGIELADEAEIRTIRASARAQAETGAPCFWHVMSGILPSFREQVHGLIDIYEQEGGDPNSLVLCHQDASGDDTNYQDAMLSRGVYFAIDNFGFESSFAFDGGYLQNPTDTERIHTLVDLLDRGWGDQLLISQDICYRMMRRTWGGWGFAHILEALPARFAAAGVDDATLAHLMVENPARLLAYAELDV